MQVLVVFAFIIALLWGAVVAFPIVAGIGLGIKEAYTPTTQSQQVENAQILLDHKP